MSEVPSPSVTDTPETKEVPSGASAHTKALPTVGSAAFWKKRMTRALLIGAFAWVATQLLPELPTDQRVEVQAPDGYLLDTVSITYFPPDQSEALSGTRLTFASATDKAFHQVRLKNGSYRIVVQAQAHDPSPASAARGEEESREKTAESERPGPQDQAPLGARSLSSAGVLLETEKVLSLTGERVRIYLSE